MRTIKRAQRTGWSVTSNRAGHLEATGPVGKRKNRSAAESGEQTYIMIKPDGVLRGLVGQIIARFEAKGFKLAGLKPMTPSNGVLEKQGMVEEQYADLKTDQGVARPCLQRGRLTLYLSFP